MRTAIYPGTFDPITFGHLDLVQRASDLFDHVIVAVASNDQKQPLFSVGERAEMARLAIAGLANVEVDTFAGLLVDYFERRGGDVIIRGLRAVSDFEYELQLALMYRKLNSRVEAVFMMPKDSYAFLSSRIVKEIARLGGEVSEFVPSHVSVALRERLGVGDRPGMDRQPQP